ncbi:MAG TPA: cupin domain-containing protein [Devosia sp.]|nr:cupin domain-containing protein [Devosia sp.]
MNTKSTDGWAPFSGFAGISQRALAGTLDETAKAGHRTRLVRFEAGAMTTEPFVHDYWEEVFVVSGTLIDADGTVSPAGDFVRRPPGLVHGPFNSPEGCELFEVHYYDRLVP